MSAINSKNLNVYNARRFCETVNGAYGANLYFTIGRTSPWSDDLTPDQANSSVYTEYEVWRNMIGGKKVTGYDLRQCVPRYNWTEGTIYSIYDDAIDSSQLFNPEYVFYVLTDN